MTKINRYATKAYEEAVKKNVKVIRNHTLAVYDKLWAENISANLDSIRQGANALDLLEKNSEKRPKHTLVIANGPSVAKYNQLQEIAASRAYQSGKLTIVACDASFEKCISAGIVPNYVTNIDGTPITAKFFYNIAQSKEVTPVASISIHPETRVAISKAFSKPIHWFIPVWDDWTDADKPSITRFLRYLCNKIYLDTMGNVGAFSQYFCGFLGATPMGLIGLDYGYPADTDIEKDQYYKAYQILVNETNAQRAVALKEMRARNPEWDGRGRVTIRDCYRLVRNPDTGVDILVGLNWDAYREEFLQSMDSMYKFLSDRNIKFPRIENLSPESSIFHKHITTRSLTDFLEEAKG